MAMKKLGKFNLKGLISNKKLVNDINKTVQNQISNLF